MKHPSVECTMMVDAKPADVWKVFTTPELTRTIGGEYVSNWETGSSFGWRGLDGTMLTHGRIIAIQPEKILQHVLYNPSTDNSDQDASIVSTITYQFITEGEGTMLTALEEFAEPISEQEYADTLAGWEAALSAIKELAE